MKVGEWLGSPREGAGGHRSPVPQVSCPPPARCPLTPQPQGIVRTRGPRAHPSRLQHPHDIMPQGCFEGGRDSTGAILPSTQILSPCHHRPDCGTSAHQEWLPYALQRGCPGFTPTSSSWPSALFGVGGGVVGGALPFAAPQPSAAKKEAA